jgi:hypothetical protein
MKGYKEPSFQDRVGRANEARQKALDALKARPVLDEAALAARRDAAAAREAAQAERRAAAQTAKEAKAAAEAAGIEQAEKGRVAAEMEKKSARDARYAARKSRT